MGTTHAVCYMQRFPHHPKLIMAKPSRSEDLPKRKKSPEVEIFAWPSQHLASTYTTISKDFSSSKSQEVISTGSFTSSAYYFLTLTRRNYTFYVPIRTIGRAFSMKNLVSFACLWKILPSWSSFAVLRCSLGLSLLLRRTLFSPLLWGKLNVFVIIVFRNLCSIFFVFWKVFFEFNQRPLNHFKIVGVVAWLGFPHWTIVRASFLPPRER